MYSIAIMDHQLIANRIYGGGFINAQTILPLFSSKYSSIYFPKSDTYFDIKKYPELLDNIEKIEDYGLTVSKTFKKLWIYGKPRSFRTYRRELLKGYIAEISGVDFVYDNDFYATLNRPPIFNPDILEICRIVKETRFGIALRGYSLVNNLNNIGLIKLILRNEPRSLLDVETLKRYISFLVHPLLDKYINGKISRCNNLQFIAVVNRLLATQNSSMSKDKNKFRFLFPSDVSQFKWGKGSIPPKGKRGIFFYSRLVPEKGIFEIPKILMEVRRLGHDVFLNVAGKFMYNKDEQTFHKLLIKYGVKEYVNVLGYLDEDALQEALSYSKVLMYPSHSDSFSISILNSIHLRTKVVSYDLPTLKDIYGDVPAVVFVKEYDTKAMALAISKILSESESSYFDTFNNQRTSEFFEITGSEKKLFCAVSELIDEALLLP